MNDNRLQSPEHSKIRTVLRVGGPTIAVVGLIFMIVGAGSFFASFGGFESPRFFWCFFAGMPLLFVGLAMSMFGYLAAFQRYVAEESAPVMKDVANYMGENIQPGVKAVAKAVAEGVMEAQKKQKQEPGS
jgi:hypothetical protein